MRFRRGVPRLAALVLIQVVQQGELRHEPLLADAAALELTAGEEAAHLLAGGAGELRDLGGGHHVRVVLQHEEIEPVRVGGAQSLHVYADLAVDVVHFALLLSFRSQSR